jgi:hypothetical protein
MIGVLYYKDFYISEKGEIKAVEIEKVIKHSCGVNKMSFFH